ncbi:MAG: NAD(P)H-hydrate dehydratase [Fibrobacter sp.]|nr:NAD(P)H-hydrate dehydratase [Fibrobacter sp.]
MVLEICAEDKIQDLLPQRNESGDKRTQGTALIVAGSANMTGAPALCAMAALRSGVGLLTLASPKSIIPILQAQLLEPVFFPLEEDTAFSGVLSRKNIAAILKNLEYQNALAIGPGLGTAATTQNAIRDILTATEKPAVVDADAINALDLDFMRNELKSNHFIFTPHLREWERNFGKFSIATDLAKVVSEMAQEMQQVFVLKASPILIGTPSGKVYAVEAKNSGMAKGGSGDVLTGIIVALLAQGLSLENAALLGVLLHQKAGRITREELGAFSMLPSDVISNLYKVFS